MKKQMMVQKRDGTLQPFNHFKIVDAVLAAFKEVTGETSDYALEKAGNIADYIFDYCEKEYDNNQKILNIEEIQTLVENGLMSLKDKRIAKAYILYREERNKIRMKNSSMMKIFSEKLSASNVQNQNANVDEHSFGGRMGEASSAMSRQYAIDYLLSDLSKNNHLNNEIYIHDLDHYALGDHNCLSIPFDKLLANGFNTRQTDVRPASSVNTAMQLVAVIFQLQSLQQFGGVSATHIDWTLVPYVRMSFLKHYKNGLKYIATPQNNGKEIKIALSKEDAKNVSINNTKIYKHKLAYEYAMDMTTSEVHQAVEGLYHNLNTLQSRSGNQLPFTSLNYGTCIEPEGRMVIKALLEVSIEGLGKLRKTPVFPCGIFQLKKGVNRKPGEPNYDLYQLALKSTAQRLYPNYANCDWTGNRGYDESDPRTFFSTMGLIA